MTTPKVSVCVPTYNGERYLRTCLDGILAQTYADFELLVVDDASTDATPSILADYQAKDARVRVSHNRRNLGLVGNWNRCIELARAPWIKFAFQDDLLAPSCLQAMLEGASKPIVFCRREFSFESGVAPDVVEMYARYPTLESTFSGHTEISAEQLCDAVLAETQGTVRNFLGEPTAALLHRSLFERFGLFNADLAQICDLEFWLRAGTNTGLAYVPQTLAWFRVHPNSASARNLDPDRDERVSLFDYLIVLHEFSVNPHFDALRQRSRRATPRRDYHLELSALARWIYAKGHAAASRDGSSAHAWTARWDKLEPLYPGMARAVREPMQRLLRIWRRHVGWRLLG